MSSPRFPASPYDLSLIHIWELQHAVERAVILAPGKLLEPDNFMLRPPYSSTTGDLETLNLMELEQKAIEKAMKKCEGNISRAAEMLRCV